MTAKTTVKINILANKINVTTINTLKLARKALKTTVINKTMAKTVKNTACDNMDSKLSKGDLGRMTGSALAKKLAKTMTNNAVNNLTCKTSGTLNALGGLVGNDPGPRPKRVARVTAEGLGSTSSIRVPLLRSGQTKRLLLRSGRTKRPLLRSGQTKRLLLRSGRAKRLLLRSGRTKRLTLPSGNNLKMGGPCTADEPDCKGKRMRRI